MLNYNLFNLRSRMLKIISNTLHKKLGSYTPPLLSQGQRGMHWAPKQNFLPES